MFQELVESTAVRKRTKKSWAFAGSAAAQSLALLVLVLIPLLYTQALPKALTGTFLVTPAPPPAAPAAPAAQQTAPTRRPVRLLHHNVLVEPTSYARHAQMIDEPPLPPESPVETGPGLLRDGLSGLGASPIAVTSSVPAPPPVPPRAITVGGKVQEAKLTARIQPIYPPIAVQTRIQGDVVLHAVIGKDGSVAELEVVSGHPLLLRAALDAVRQWRYQPTLLNGEPVEVETTITVSFVLSH